MAKQEVHVVVFKDAESDQWVVECLEYDVSTQGDSVKDALAMIKEAVQLHLEEQTEADLEVLYQEIEGEPQLHIVTIDAPTLLRR
jgi:predicted RNase H-like HicB family nuclease